MKSKPNHFTRPSHAHLVAISLGLALPCAHAQSVWKGTTNSVFSTGSNFDPLITNTNVSNLNIQFDGSDATTEDLTLAVACGGGAGTAGSAYTILSAQTNPLTITGSGSAAIRLSTGLTVEADAGAVTFADTGLLAIGGLSTASSHAIQNLSSNLLDLGTWSVISGGGNARSLTVEAVGDIESLGNWSNSVSPLPSSNPLSLTKTGVGKLTLGGTNTITGNTLVSEGTLELTNALALQNSALDTSGAGTVTVVGPTALTLGGLTGSINLASVITTGYSGGITDLTLNPRSGTQTYSGIIADGATGMNLVKSGAGRQVLSGSNSYTGTTSINGGFLRLGAADALGTTTEVSVNGGSGSIGATIGNFDLAGFSPATVIPLKLNSGANNNDIGAFYNTGGATLATYSGAVTLLRSTIVGAGNIELTGGFDGAGFSLNKNGLQTLTITNGGNSNLNELKANRGTIQVNSGTTLSVASIVTGSGNSVGSGLTLNGGSVTCSGTSLFGTATTPADNIASGTLTLNSGTLTVVGLSKGPGAAATVQFNVNFNGGTLKASGDNAAFLTTANNAKVRAGGALINDGGFLIEIPQPLIHDSVLGATPDGGLTKSGAGTLTLSGANTYTGNTTVSAGALDLAATGSLKFVPTAPGTTNKVTGPGTADFNGTFTIDLTNADPTDGNAWVLADVSTQTFDPGTFTVSGFIESPEGTWTLMDGTKTWTFTQGDATLRLVVSPAGFASWITGFGLAPADLDPTDNPDNDGMDNLLEFALNGNPSISDPSIMPDLDITTDPAAFEFTYQRRDDSVFPETTQTFEWGTTLATWPGSAAIPAASGSVPPATITVTAGTPDDGVTDTVKISIPKTQAGSTGKLFGRLMVVKP
ncbi:MAG: autotransporter-associated beta strand repeat-containing protein [Akkermansiaceae bacterium]